MKRIALLLLAFIYIGAMCISTILIVKPGASIFYYQEVLDNQMVNPDAGFAYRYNLEVNTSIFLPQGMLLYEDGVQIGHSNGKVVVETGRGVFSLSDPSQEALYLYFSSTDNSNPITNGRKYTAFLPVIFLSRTMGIIFLILLLPGLAWFLVFLYRPPDRNKISVRSLMDIPVILDSFAEHVVTTIKANSSQTAQRVKPRVSTWKRLFTVTILIAYFYILMEWVFFVTKPSFMDIMSFGGKLEIFLLSGLLLSVMSMVLLVAYVGLDIVSQVFHFHTISRLLIALIPTAILTASVLLLIDNFTYTVLRFGITTSAGLWRGVYGLLFILLFIYIYRKILGFFDLKEGRFSPLPYIVISLLLISTGLALLRLDLGNFRTTALGDNNQGEVEQPNILLLGSDGLNANNLSVYGYERETTPNLKRLAPDSLVIENAFTNSSHSAGSIISMLTGKLPTKTRVLYPPDILTGVDAYQHLPGILKEEGYKSVEFGVPHYIDAYTFNLQNGFDIVNNRTPSEGRLGVFLRALGYEDIAYFLNTLAERIFPRILHIFFIRNMQNPINIVTQPVSHISDEEKIEQMLDIIEESDDPVFIHTHLMGTHGSMFNPPVRIYSRGKTQDQPWNRDFYDDTIRSFDSLLGTFIDRLKEIEQFDNTILIIYSDHAMNYQVNERIPLIFHFPGGDFVGKITSNVQNLDIAPTVLDYLGLSKPEWMDGKSILDGILDSHRLILGTGSDKFSADEQGLVSLRQDQIKPPFYQFSFYNIIECQKWYRIDLTSFEWSSGDIPGYTGACSEDSLLSKDKIQENLTQLLVADGFNNFHLP